MVISALVLIPLIVRNLPLSSARIAELREQMLAPHPQTRLSAARRLLRHNPLDEQAVEIAVESLLEMRRPPAAHELLTGYFQNQPLYKELRARVLITEIDHLIDSATSSNMSIRQEDIEERLGELEQVRLSLLEDDRPEITSLLNMEHARLMQAFKARQLDFLEVELERLSFLGEMGAGRSNLAASVGRLRLELNETQQAFTDALARVEADFPQSPVPASVRFRKAMAAGDLAQAADMVERLIRLEHLPRRIAGEAAVRLLRVEAEYGLPRTQELVESARALVHHPSLQGSSRVDLLQAHWELAIIDEDFEAALEYAEQLERSGHPEAGSLMARTMARLGDVDDAIVLLQKILDQMRGSAETHYALGEIFSRTDDRTEALLQFRQVLDFQPRHLPALLHIAGMRDEAGSLELAAQEIEMARSINPLHPQVIDYWARLLVRQQDDDRIGSLIVREFAGRTIDARLLALVLAMAWDDTERVSRQAQAYLAAEPLDLFFHLAKGWPDTDQERRAYIASAVARGFEELLTRDPLGRWDEPACPVNEWNQRLTRPFSELDLRPNEAYLAFSRFARTPLEEALAVMEAAMVRGMVDQGLLVQIAELAFLLRRYDTLDLVLELLEDRDQKLLTLIEASYRGRHHEVASLLETLPPELLARPAARMARLRLSMAEGRWSDVAEQIQDELANRAWPFEFVAQSVEESLRLRQWEVTDLLPALAKPTHPYLGALIESRINLARGRPRDVIESLEMTALDPRNNLQVRRWAADLVASAYLQLNELTRALAALDRILAERHIHDFGVQLATIDVLIEAGAQIPAIKAIQGLLFYSEPTARRLDETLVRARLVMPASQMLTTLDDLLTSRESDRAVLRWWRTDTLMRMERWAEAEDSLRDVLQDRPNSPRALLLAARYYARTDRQDEAGRYLDRAKTMGGALGILAEGEKRRLGIPTRPAPQTMPESESVSRRSDQTLEEAMPYPFLNSAAAGTESLRRGSAAKDLDLVLDYPSLDDEH